MWLYTVNGFLSVVDKGERSDEGEVMLCVRSRARDDLSDLQDYLSVVAHKHINIEETYHNDYQYRMNVLKLDFMMYMAKKVSEIKYSNFKNECYKSEAYGSRPEAVGGLGKIWQTTYEYLGENHRISHDEWDPEKEFL